MEQKAILLFVEQALGLGLVRLWGLSDAPGAKNATPKLMEKALESLKPSSAGATNTLESKTHAALKAAMDKNGLQLIAEINCPDQPIGYRVRDDKVKHYPTFLLRLGCTEVEDGDNYDFVFDDKRYRLPSIT